jgi:hypothetical protein
MIASSDASFVLKKQGRQKVWREMGGFHSIVGIAGFWAFWKDRVNRVPRPGCRHVAHHPKKAQKVSFEARPRLFVPVQERPAAPEP